jgi:hypothetical protein
MTSPMEVDGGPNPVVPSLQAEPGNGRREGFGKDSGDNASMNVDEAGVPPQLPLVLAGAPPVAVLPAAAAPRDLPPPAAVAMGFAPAPPLAPPPLIAEGQARAKAKARSRARRPRNRGDAPPADGVDPPLGQQAPGPRPSRQATEAARKQAALEALIRQLWAVKSSASQNLPSASSLRQMPDLGSAPTPSSSSTAPVASAAAVLPAGQPSGPATAGQTAWPSTPAPR